MTRLGRLLRTTAFRLALVYLVLTTILAAALLVSVAYQTNRVLETQIDAALRSEITALDAIHQTAGIVGLVRAVERRAQRPGSDVYLLTTPVGNALAGNVIGYDLAILEEASTRVVEYHRDEEAGRERPRSALARTAVLPGGFRLLVGRDLDEQERFFAIFWQTGAIAGLAVLALGLGGAWFVARRVTRRIEEVGETSRSIMAGDLARRLPLSGGDDEFDRLAASVNAMLNRIEVLMRGLKEVSDNIAHDLKTPLTRLRNRTEEALRRDTDTATARAILERNLEDAEGLIRTFDALLLIARTESGAGAETFAPVDLRQVAGGVAELYDALAEEKGGRVIVADGPTVVVAANRELLAQALANLVDNAIKHMDRPTGGPATDVTITLTTTEVGADIVVADRGPGIPEADRARVLDRFVRLEESRSRPGAGLGLSLVSAIAKLHGGSLMLEDNAPGLKATLRLGPGTRTQRT